MQNDTALDEQYCQYNNESNSVFGTISDENQAFNDSDEVMINEEEDHKSNHGDPIGSEARIINQEEDKSNSSESNTEEPHHITCEECQIVIYQSRHIQEELKEKMKAFSEEQEDIQPLPPFPYLPNEELFVKGGGRIAEGTGLLA